MIDPTKDNFTQPLSVKETLDKLEISKGDYDRVLSTPKDKDLELLLKRQTSFCFVNNYVCLFVGLKAWQANKDKKPAFIEYKAVVSVPRFLKN